MADVGRVYRTMYGNHAVYLGCMQLQRGLYNSDWYCQLSPGPRLITPDTAHLTLTRRPSWKVFHVMKRNRHRLFVLKCGREMIVISGCRVFKNAASARKWWSPENARPANRSSLKALNELLKKR